ncbi:hypothetical protein [Thermoanaerobacter pentosaceus]|uniref:Uncharacterized protein YxeA n=1 Tax=Thermoanaerobacter pentosaceus TaxID=694059 RepID=A0ABT9M3H5_9THEO|nr:hypothetical protein [Thermoanaerobacter pentosaceus]MDP9750676.1 uncharacterized protein YxeA [Thermoanaerobacter pentosaceus]
MKKIILLLMILVFTLFINAYFVYANDLSNGNDNTIPDSVLEKVKSKVEKSQFKLPEIRAWEIDKDGSKREVIPKSIKNNNNLISTMGVPNDGYIYVFDHYDPNYASKNWHYASAGTYRLANYTNTPINGTYKQLNTKQIYWNVSANVSGETTVGNGFLAGIKLKTGVEVDRSQTWYAGKEYGVAFTVPPRTVYYLTNYQVGINSSGLLYWKKYSPSGTSWLGWYTETAGGTVIDKDDINIEVTDSEPM